MHFFISLCDFDQLIFKFIFKCECIKARSSGDLVPHIMRV